MINAQGLIESTPSAQYLPEALLTHNPDAAVINRITVVNTGAISAKVRSENSGQHIARSCEAH